MSFELTGLEWTLAVLTSFVLGIHKAGVKGIAITIVAMMAIIFGGKPSTGILLPMLIAGDIFAVIYYHRHAEWKYFLKLTPWMIVGVVGGAWFGEGISEELFKRSMAIIILISVAMMFWWDQLKSQWVPNHWTFSTGMGLVAGFTTMVGNLAGSFANLYFLAMRSPKNNFIGTSAWLFLFINLFKTPFHVFGWGTITWETLQLNLMLLPPLILGIFLGVRLVRVFKESQFRQFILIATAIGAVLIFFR